VEAILRPFVIDSLRRQMVDELASNISTLLASDYPLIQISGSADILTVLKDKFASSQATIDYKPDDAADVRIVAQNTVIESQLRAWIKRFDLSKEQE
jgi:cytidylate kinase